MLKKTFRFLQYDEVTLFCMNYAFLLVLLLEFYTQSFKASEEIFMMVGGGAILAVWVAVMTWMDSVSRGESFEFYFPAIYTVLYKLLILWFMGLFDGIEIAGESMGDREAGRIEAVICTALVTALAIDLSLVLEWRWWHTVHACVFYTLSINKLIMWLITLVFTGRADHGSESAADGE